jgi:hypothetical protein
MQACLHANFVSQGNTDVDSGNYLNSPNYHFCFPAKHGRGTGQNNPDTLTMQFLFPWETNFSGNASSVLRIPAAETTRNGSTRASIRAFADSRKGGPRPFRLIRSAYPSKRKTGSRCRSRRGRAAVVSEHPEHFPWKWTGVMLGEGVRR